MSSASEKSGKPTTLPVAAITAAPWNTHQKQKKSDPEFDGLVRSIRKQGMIHRIAVRPIGDGRYEVVDGHRRLQAAKAIGWTDVKCEVIDLSDSEAMAMTVTANVQRLENDPFLEADLIASMAKDGRTFRDIADVMGKDEAYVVRRARLTELIPEWRKFAKSHDCTIDLLRNVASHARELQKAVADASDLDGYDEDCGRIGWDEFEREFESRMRSVAEAADVFDTAECRSCPNNTANNGLLFPWIENGDGGTCQCENCYVRKWNEAVDALCERLRKTGMKPVEVSDKWKIPNCYDLAEVSDQKHPVPYVFESGGLKRVLWSVAREKPQSAVANLTPEQKAEAKARKTRAKNLRDAYSRIRSAYSSATEESRRDLFEKAVASKNCRSAVVEHILEEGRSWASDSFLSFVVALTGGLAKFAKAYGVDGQFTDGETEAWESAEAAEAETEEESAE